MANQTMSNLPGIKDLLERTCRIYKERLGVFLGIMIIPLIISLLGTFFPSSRGLIFGIITFFLALLGIWAQLAILYAIKEREKKIGVVETFKKTWHKIISFLWISVLFGFIATGGLSLFIIPGIIFIIWFSLASYVFVTENLKGMDALFRSKQLVSGNWTKVFWRFFAIVIILLIVTLGISLPFVTLGEPIKDIINSIIQLLLTPFYLIFLFLVYEDLRRVKAEIPFQPPAKGTKIKYILLGILGFILFLIILLSSPLVPNPY